MAATTRSTLLNLPAEILHLILIEGGATALGALSGSCHTLRNYIRNNRVLHKELYLRDYVSSLDCFSLYTIDLLQDEPLVTDNGDEHAWEDELKKLAILDRLVTFQCIEERVRPTRPPCMGTFDTIYLRKPS